MAVTWRGLRDWGKIWGFANASRDFKFCMWRRDFLFLFMDKIRKFFC